MRNTHIVLISVLAVVIAIMIGIYGSAETYSTFSIGKLDDKDRQVIVKLIADSPMVYNEFQNTDKFTFYAYDKNKITSKVIYLGAKPHDFERSDEILLTGKMEGNHFTASKMLMKCPSKYTEGSDKVMPYDKSGSLGFIN